MENVLVIKTETLGDILAENGLLCGRETEVMALIRSQGEFIPRPAAEEDPSYRQIIPYVSIVRGDEVFVTRRLNKGGEARLHGKMALGVGGHMNEIDEAGEDWLMNCLRREVAEEVAMENMGELTLRGLINDGGDAVGSVHLGFFFTLTTSGQVSVLETEKLEGGFVSIPGLMDNTDDMEGWSRIVAPRLVELWTAGSF